MCRDSVDPAQDPAKRCLHRVALISGGSVKIGSLGQKRVGANSYGISMRNVIVQVTQAGVRSFIITFDVYVIPNIFEKYDNKRPDPICLGT